MLPRKPKNVEIHHNFPQHFQPQFEAMGINIHHPRWLSFVNSSKHSRFSAEFDKRWDDFFEMGAVQGGSPALKRARAIRYARRLAEEFDYAIHF